MLLFAEPQCHGLEHVPFNAALLATARAAYPDRPLVFLAEPEHGRLVGEELERHGIANVRIAHLNPPPRHASGAARMARESSNVLAVAREARALGALGVQLTSVTTAGWMALKLLWPRDAPPVAVVPHALLGKLEAGDSWFDRVFSGSGAPVHLLLLAPTIEHRLLSLLPSFRGLTAAIDHPYFFAPSKPRLPGTPVVLGSIGQAHPGKGSRELLELARRIRERRLTDSLVVRHIGPVADAELERSELVERVSGGGDGFLSPDAFARAIEGIDYALFLYPSTSYRLTVSGALFDALAHLKPVLALENPYFAHVFRVLGKPGRLFHDAGALADHVLGLPAHPDSSEFVLWAENIARFRDRFSPQAVAPRFARAWSAWMAGEPS